MTESRRINVLRAIYALCLLGGTTTHVAIVVQHGLFWDYGGVPWMSAAFWTVLTLVDPLTVVLLFVRRNLGIATVALLIVADVAHNLWITARFHPPLLQGVVNSPAVMAQIAFLLFVFATAPFAWERAKVQA
jgi:hypothetical protein